MAKKQKRATKGEGSLYLRGEMWWYKDPTGKCHPCKTKIKSEALDFKQNWIVQHKTGIKPSDPPPGVGITVDQILDDYLVHLKLKNKKSLRIVTGMLAARIRPVFGKRLASSIQTSDAEEYREQMLKTICPSTGRLYTDVTINRHLASFHAAFVHGFKRRTPKTVHTVPYFPMADESHNVREGFIEQDGYEAILKELPPSIAPVFICGYHVSTRKGELLQIRWSQVDLRDGLIEMEPRTAKNSAGRYLPIYGDMVEALSNQKRLRDREYPQTDFLFYWHTSDCLVGHGGLRSEPGSQITSFYATWNAAIERASEKCKNVPANLLFHDLRRSATRNMRRAGIDQSLRMKISGHKTTSMEQRYNIMDDTDIQAVGRRMEEFRKAELEKVTV